MNDDDIRPGTDPAVDSGNADKDVRSPQAAQSPASEMGIAEPGPSDATAGRADATSTTYSANQTRRVRDLLTRLYAVRRAARFYPIDHPAIVDGVRSLAEAIERYHKEGVDVALAFFEGELVFGEQLLTEDSIMFDQLIRELTALGVGTLVFRRGLSIAELRRAAAILAMEPSEVEAVGGIQRAANEAGLVHVEFGALKAFDKSGPQSIGDKEAKEAYSGALELVREIDTLIRRNQVVSAAKITGVVRSLVDNVLANRYAMVELTGLRNHDEYTFYHSANVALLSLALGSAITNDYRFLSSLATGALLHDIGKMTVDPDILNKPGALSPGEWALVRQHPVRGAQQAALIPALDKSAIVVILEHHMRHDGSGYPGRVRPRRQHLASRIVAVADAYDAMTSRRAYSAARVQDEAMEVLFRGSGTSHDPDLVRMFVSLMGVYPPRSVVRLTDGSVGIVLRPSGLDMLRPVVRLIADPTGAIVDVADVDLSAEDGLGVMHTLSAADVNIDIDDYL
ncbi:MAG: HD domain-containing protein [Actinomycetota bacterium]|nr:HD domain-containing protein [Actinomycetota bacterium]